MSASRKSTFTSDLEFCSQCGSILPLPGHAAVVTCKQCKYQIDVTEFDGVEMVSRVIFNKRQIKAQALTSEDFSGPTIDKKCPKCDNDGMTYATRQTRGADEGQTVFYSCPKCNFQESEFS